MPLILNRKTLYALAVPAVVVVLGAAWLLDFRSGSGGQTQYETAPVTRGQIRRVVTTSGPVRALVTVSIGSQLSGQVREVKVDFNSEVRKGDELAVLDDKTFASKVVQARADVTAARAAPVQPETALAAFALGMAIDLTTSSSGEDVEYALVDAPNVPVFFDKGQYQAFIQQKGVSVDVQRRYAPLEGTYFFALRSDNWVNAIDVHVDIEAVTEEPVFAEELYLMNRE